MRKKGSETLVYERNIIGCLWWGGAPPAESPCLPWMRISLPRHDLLGEERLLISQRRRARSLFLMGFYWVNLHRNTDKAHQSLSGSNDQTIDNIQRTMRAYSELAKGP